MLEGVWRHPNRAGWKDSGVEENETTSKGKKSLKIQMMKKKYFDDTKVVEENLSQGLNAEINDIQSEFEKDRQDYLDSIR